MKITIDTETGEIDVGGEVVVIGTAQGDLALAVVRDMFELIVKEERERALN